MGQHQRITGPIINDAAAFTPSMSTGYQPERPRILLGPKLPQPLSQTTHTAATFSPEMVEGHQPKTGRLFLKPQLGWQWAETTFLVVMSPDMFGGWHPDTSRAWIAPRIPLPLGQPTHTAAAFSLEMSAGQRPDAKRLHVLGKDGWSTSQLTFLVAMSPDMFKGWLPDTSRAWLAPKIALPLSQPTHTPAPITLDMLKGNQPETPRLSFAGKPGWMDSQLTFIAAMTPEMFKGWIPDRYRQLLGPKIAQPLSQPTHTSAPLSVEMTQGSQPSTARSPWRLRSLLTLVQAAVLELVARFVSDAEVTSTSDGILRTTSLGDERSTSGGDVRTTADGDLRTTSDGDVRTL